MEDQCMAESIFTIEVSYDSTIGIDSVLLSKVHVGVWTPKIDRATQPFLGLSDMQQGLFLNSTGRQGLFLNSTGRQELFLNSTGRHYHFL